MSKNQLPYYKIYFLHNLTTTELEAANWQICSYSFASIQAICDNRAHWLEGVNFGAVISEEYFLFKVKFIKNITRQMRIQVDKQIFEIKRIVDFPCKKRLINIIALKIN